MAGVGGRWGELRQRDPGKYPQWEGLSHSQALKGVWLEGRKQGEERRAPCRPPSGFWLLSQEHKEARVGKDGGELGGISSRVGGRAFP